MHILVISPHPDDESIGCGGTLRRHVEAGDAVCAVFLTSGEKGGHGRSEEETRALREQEARSAAGILGICEASFFRLPDGAVQCSADAVAQLRSKITVWQPEIVYLPHQHEMHSDHRAAVRLLKRAYRGWPTGPAAKALMYEIWTPMRQMDEIVDITPHVEFKRAAIRAHASQCQVMDFEAAALGLNRYRGEMHSWPGGEYAEVFAELRLNGEGAQQ